MAKPTAVEETGGAKVLTLADATATTPVANMPAAVEVAPSGEASWPVGWMGMATHADGDSHIGPGGFVTGAAPLVALGGKSFEGEGGVGKIYPNIWAAESGLDQLKTQSYTAWFSPKNPQKATLQRKFPLKPLISAAIILFLILYFLILGFYVQRKG